MILRTIRFDGTRYALAADQDYGAIKHAAVRAAQAGGGLVDFEAAGGPSIAILVTHAIPLMFEEREIVLDADDGAADAPVPQTLVDFD